MIRKGILIFIIISSFLRLEAEFIETDRLINIYAPDQLAPPLSELLLQLPDEEIIEALQSENLLIYETNYHTGIISDHSTGITVTTLNYRANEQFPIIDKSHEKFEDDIIKLLNEGNGINSANLSDEFKNFSEDKVITYGKHVLRFEDPKLKESFLTLLKHSRLLNSGTAGLDGYAFNIKSIYQGKRIAYMHIWSPRLEDYPLSLKFYNLTQIFMDELPILNNTSDTAWEKHSDYFKARYGFDIKNTDRATMKQARGNLKKSFRNSLINLTKEIKQLAEIKNLLKMAYTNPDSLSEFCIAWQAYQEKNTHEAGQSERGIKLCKTYYQLLLNHEILKQVFGNNSYTVANTNFAILPNHISYISTNLYQNLYGILPKPTNDIRPLLLLNGIENLLIEFANEDKDKEAFLNRHLNLYLKNQMEFTSITMPLDFDIRTDQSKNDALKDFLGNPIKLNKYYTIFEHESARKKVNLVKKDEIWEISDITAL